MPIAIRKQQVPWIMAAARAALGPFVVLGEACRWNGLTLASMIVAALLSDIFDGVLARRWHCDTAAVRLFDSMADTVFYLGVAIALWIGHPQLVRDQAPLLAALFGLEALRFVFDTGKFGKPASYHSFLAKTWGLLLAVSVTAEFATGHASALIVAAILFGIVCNLEGLTMSLILPTWCNDVKTLPAAWRLRRRLLACAHKYPRTSSDNNGNRARQRTRGRVMAAAALTAAIGFALPALAVEPGHATYLNGTLKGLPAGMDATLDATASDGLVFKAAPLPAAGVYIAYDKIEDVDYTTEVTHHLGVLAAIAVSLVRRRERNHTFAISYLDDAGAKQSVLLEVSKQQADFLVPLLRARALACTAKQKHCILFAEE